MYFIPFHERWSMKDVQMPKTFELFSFPVSGWWLSLDDLFRISNFKFIHIFTPGIVYCMQFQFLYSFHFYFRIHNFPKWITNFKLLCSKFYIFLDISYLLLFAILYIFVGGIFEVVFSNAMAYQWKWKTVHRRSILDFPCDGSTKCNNLAQNIQVKILQTKWLETGISN